MWNALRSDLKEFVSNVREDTSNVLSKLDSGLKIASENDYSSMATTPTSGLAMSVATSTEQERAETTTTSTQQEENESPDTTNDGKDNDDDGGSPSDNEIEEILQLLIEDPNTFTEPVAPNDDGAKEFVDSFDIESKTEDITKMLQEDDDEQQELNNINNNQNVLKQQFESLVPTEVSYPEFWQRYYYRCSAEYVRQQWNDETVVELRQRRGQQHLDFQDASATGAIEAFGSLLGGAVKAVSQKIAEQEESYFQEDGRKDKTATATTTSSTTATTDTTDLTAGALSFFSGATGRPPFVMNTAVSEDDDDHDKGQDDDDDDEEELGWDDDDDIDDEGDEDNKDNDADNEIEFTSREKIEEQLKQALEERDQVLATVAMQKEQIEALQKQQGGAMITTMNRTRKNNDEIESLKMNIFEKESEIAALKASLNDYHQHPGDHPTDKDADSMMKLSALEAILRKLPKGQVYQLKKTIFEDNDDDDDDNNRAQQQEIEKQKQNIQSLENKIESLQVEHENKNQKQYDQQEQVISQLNEKVKLLKTNLEEVKQILDTTKKQKEKVEKELQIMKQQQQQQQEPENPSASSDASSDTGVKILPPRFSSVAAAATTTPLSTTSTFLSTKTNEEEIAPATDEEDDDWGDDWD